MNFRQTLKTTYSTVGSTLTSVEKSAKYINNLLDEALEVQEATKDLRVNQAIAEQVKEFSDSVTTLNAEDVAKITTLNEAIAQFRTKPEAKS